MEKLSVIIPARNEPFLNKTVDGLFENAEEEIEIIVMLDGYWPNPPLKKHNNLIIAFDYDDTIFDYHNKDFIYPNVIELLEECSEIGLTLILFTSKEDAISIAKIKNQIESDYKINISYINESPIMNTIKPFFNILLDDKAGLKQAYDILSATIKKIKVRENLAKNIHQLWERWAKSIIKTESLSKERLERWKSCFVSYDSLSEKMKNLDRKIADEFISILKKEN